MNKKILVLGSTGMLGHQVYYYLSNKINNKIYNISFRKKINDETILCNVRDEKKLEDIIVSINPDVIVNCIGVLIRGSNSNPENAIFINSYLPHLLVSISDKLNARLIHISTDCVFSGEKGNSYNENDFKDGKDIYANSKSLGEIINDRHLTLRTSVIGPELKTDGESLFNWFMFQKKEINGYTNVLWSGVSTLVLAKVIYSVIENKINGLYHVTNNNPIDKFSLLNLIKKHTKKDILIHPSAEIKINKSFIDTRKKLKLTIPTYEEMVKEMILQIKNNKDIYTHYNF